MHPSPAKAETKGNHMRTTLNQTQTKAEARAREIVKTVVPHYWELFDAFYDAPEWEELKDAGAWGAALAKMGEAFANFIFLHMGEMFDAEQLYVDDEDEKRKARAARRRERWEAAKAAKGNG